MTEFRRYRPDPADQNNTIDEYSRQLAKTNDPAWAIAIELARIADAMEPDETCENLFTQLETISDALSGEKENLLDKLDRIKVSIDDLYTGA